MKKTNRNAILILLSGFFIFLLGIGVGKSVPLSESSYKNVKEQVIKDLEQKLNSKAEKRLIPPNLSNASQETEQMESSLTGEIVEIDSQNNIIKVEVENKYEGGNLFSYLEEPDYYIKTIMIDRQTKVVEKERKDNENFKREMQEYREYMEKRREGELSESDRPVSPKSFIEIEVAIRDLESGAKVFVESEIEFNLSGDKEISAKKIEIIQ